MKHIKIMLAFFLCLMSVDLSAQAVLTEAQKKEFKNRVKQKVEEFQKGLSNIVNNQLEHNIRKENVVNVLKLYIGEGEPYDYFDTELERRVHNNGVIMQTSSLYRKYKQTQRLKSYIYKLYNPNTGLSKMKYSKIIIESASAVRVDNIEKVGDHYECVAYFSQKFIGYGDNNVINYGDLSSKKIRCYIYQIDLPTGKQIFEAKLGDIYVLSTKRL